MKVARRPRVHRLVRPMPRCAASRRAIKPSTSFGLELGEPDADCDPELEGRPVDQLARLQHGLLDPVRLPVSSFSPKRSPRATPPRARSHVYSAHLLVNSSEISSAVISLREESVERSLLVGPGVGPRKGLHSREIDWARPPAGSRNHPRRPRPAWARPPPTTGRAGCRCVSDTLCKYEG